MKYRIEYADGKCCSFVSGRSNLIQYLKQSVNENISDIRKVFKSGATDSVMDLYRMYIKII